jgi:hypothetical protein
MKRTGGAAALAATVIAMAACGTGDEPKKVSDGAALRIVQAHIHLSDYCVARLDGEGWDGAAYRRALRAVDLLNGHLRDDPDARVGETQTVRGEVTAASDKLSGCDVELKDSVDRALARARN